MKKLQNNKSGFTIIEVLIVLAIAGLIMLIVFLAVPALQRNSRNTQYRNDAAAYLGAVNEFMASNNGNLPANGNNLFGPTNADATTIQNSAKTQNIKIFSIVTATTGGSQTANLNAAYIVKGAKCGTISGTDTHTYVSGPGKAVIVVYPIENSSGNAVAQCTEG
jgi:prepilin-type N-terminal cleavage/methylation domain-containing protein